MPQRRALIQMPPKVTGPQGNATPEQSPDNLFDKTLDAIYGFLGVPGAPQTRINEGAGLLGLLAGAPMLGKLLFHGSPHLFPPVEGNPLGAFDRNMRSAGEGAAAFGVGDAYLAESPQIAKGYAERLGKSFARPVEALREYFKPGRVVDSFGGGKDRVVSFNESAERPNQWSVTVQSERPQDAGTVFARPRTHATEPSWDEIEKVTGLRPGHVYTVDVPDNALAKMLDWDAPMGQQHQTVRDALAKLTSTPTERYPNWRIDDQTLGKGFYDWLSHIAGSPDQASLTLEELGVPGIRYLDALSRRQTATPTRNVVLFNGSDARIVNRTTPSKVGGQ